MPFGIPQGYTTRSWLNKLDTDRKLRERRKREDDLRAEFQARQDKVIADFKAAQDKANAANEKRYGEGRSIYEL